MPYDLHDKLVIAISSRALFDLEYENAIYDKDSHVKPASEEIPSGRVLYKSDSKLSEK
ncbi:MAG: 5'-nucleotidase [Clostridiaceae bacterium]